MKKLYFVRHGLSEGNLNQIFADGNSPLAPEGLEQAAAVAEALNSGDYKIDSIIASPMVRALHTAKIIANGVNYPENEIETNQLFVERNFGNLTGSSSKDFYKIYGVKAVDSIEGAETLPQLEARAEQALAFVKNHPSDNILIVSHGAFGRAVRRVVEGRPYTDEYDGPKFIDNGEIIELI